MIEIQIDLPPNFESTMIRLAAIPGAMKKAATRAIRRTLRGGRQDAARKIGQRYTIAVGAVTRTIKIKVGGLEGEMLSRGSRHALKKFHIRPKKRPRRMPAGGQFVQNVRGQGGYLSHAFLGNNSGVVERVGASRYPLRLLTGPSSPGMLGNPIVGPYIENKMYERMKINLDHEANAIINGFA